MRVFVNVVNAERAETKIMTKWVYFLEHRHVMVTVTNILGVKALIWQKWRRWICLCRRLYDYHRGLHLLL